MKNSFEFSSEKNGGVADKTTPRSEKPERKSQRNSDLDKATELISNITNDILRENLMKEAVASLVQNGRVMEARKIVESLSTLGAKIEAQGMILRNEKQEENSTDIDIQRMEELEQQIEEDPTLETRNFLRIRLGKRWAESGEYPRAKAVAFSVEEPEKNRDENPFSSTKYTSNTLLGMRDEIFMTICKEQSKTSLQDAKKTLELIKTPNATLEASISFAKAVLKEKGPNTAWEVFRGAPTNGYEAREAFLFLTKLLSHPQLQSSLKTSIEAKRNLFENAEEYDDSPDSSGAYWYTKEVEAYEKIGRFDLIRTMLEKDPLGSFDAGQYAREGKVSLAYIVAETIPDPKARAKAIKNVEDLTNDKTSDNGHPYRAHIHKPKFREPTSFGGSAGELKDLQYGYANAVAADLRQGRDPSASIPELEKIIENPSCDRDTKYEAIRTLALIETVKGNISAARVYESQLDEYGRNRVLADAARYFFTVKEHTKKAA